LAILHGTICSLKKRYKVEGWLVAHRIRPIPLDQTADTEIVAVSGVRPLLHENSLHHACTNPERPANLEDTVAAGLAEASLSGKLGAGRLDPGGRQPC
jgi:hypothetical protein